MPVRKSVVLLLKYSNTVLQSERRRVCLFFTYQTRNGNTDIPLHAAEWGPSSQKH